MELCSGFLRENPNKLCFIELSRNCFAVKARYEAPGELRIKL